MLFFIFFFDEYMISFFLRLGSLIMESEKSREFVARIYCH